MHRERHHVDISLKKSMERTIKQAMAVKLTQEEDLIVNRVLMKLTANKAVDAAASGIGKVYLPGLEVNQGGGI